MTSNGNFSHAAQQAHQWVGELAADLNCDEHQAYRLLKSVLHALREWLSPQEMADLSAQLPVLIRGIYFEGWKPVEKAEFDRKKRDFVIRVRASMVGDSDIDIDTSISAVFKLLDRHVSHGEIVQVRNSMKKSLRELWPAD